jgi:hypothetical protein
MTLLKTVSEWSPQTRIMSPEILHARRSIAIA